MKCFYLLVFLCSYFGVNCLSQYHNGLIIESTSQQPIPFVNISIKNTYLGTVSDTDGNYKLVVPVRYAEATICFSCIGYDSKEISVQQLRNNPNVTLTKANVQLSEVTIMPDSTLRSFLRRAYEKIPENYPSYPTQYEGFYREGLQNSTKTYARLVEAITLANKSSYRNSQSGTVKIVESRKYNNEAVDKYFPLWFYGGPHFVHEVDYVKNRADFLKPHKHYQYHYAGLTTYQGRLVHQVNFLPQPNKQMPYKGRIYIDKESLAYLRVELDYTQSQLKKRFSNLLFSNGLNAIEKAIHVNYSLIDSVCFMKSIYENEIIRTKNDSIYYSPLEYVVTSIATDEVETIEYAEQIPVSYTPSLDAMDYRNSNWKSYATLKDVIQADTLLHKQVFTNSSPQKSGSEWFAKMMQKLDVSYGIGYRPYEMREGSYLIGIEGESYSSHIKDAGTTLVVDALIAYNVSRKLNIGYNLSSGLSTNNLLESHGPRIAYKLPLKTMGKNLFLEPQVGYVWQKYGRSVGIKEFNNDFSFGGKMFKNKRVQALPGIKHHGVQLGGSLLYQLLPILYLDVAASYYKSVASDEVLYLKEQSGFFLTRKTAHEALNNTDAVLMIDGVSTQKSGVSYDNWSLSVGVRIIF